MRVTIRRFEREDIDNKVRWINDPANSTYLHYDLPLEFGKTSEWFERNKNRNDRYDAVIEADGMPVGLIGLISIDKKNKKAEYYVSLGEKAYIGKGIALKASRLILAYAFETLLLEKVYLFTETKNIAAQKLFERLGFKKEGIIRKDLLLRGRHVDRIAFGMTKEEYFTEKSSTEKHCVGNIIVESLQNPSGKGKNRLET